MAKAQEAPGIDPELPYGEAAARILATRAQELADHSESVLDLGDIERLHDMRVATRRLRAALEVFESCFPRSQHRAVLGEVKELADALGERRDRDVAITSLHGFAERLTVPDRPGVRSLERRLESEQIAANETLAPRVTEERIAGLRQRLRELAAAAAEAAGPGPAAPAGRGKASDPMPSADGTQSNGAGVAADGEGGAG